MSESQSNINSSRFWKLGDFFRKQHETDQLQLELMKIFYSNCYKVHMEKKLQKKPQKSNITIKMTEQERGLNNFLEIVDECTEKQAWFPNQNSVKQILDISEEGWTIMAHWMRKVFRVSNCGLELTCETCAKLQCISEAFEKYLTKRNEFLMYNSSALDPYEKFVDIWSQVKFSSLQSTIYKLKDHPSANAFTRGFSQCTMTYFVFSRDLQGADPKKHQTLVTVLEALTLNSSIYSIDVSELLLVHDASVKALCNMIRKKKNLKRIVFSRLSLGKSSYSSDIINAVLEAPLLQDLSIYIYEELDSSFRFLEGTPTSLLYNLGNHHFEHFKFSSHDFSFPIETLSILEGMLKNRYLKTIEFDIQNNDRFKKNQYIDYLNKMGNIIGSVDQFHFTSYNIPNITLNQNLRLMKKSTNLKKRQYRTRELLGAIISDELYSCVGSEFFLDCGIMEEFGLSHVSNFCKYITKLDIDFTDNLTENEWELICKGIMESETLEVLKLCNVNVLQKNNLNFSHFSQLKQSSKLTSLFLQNSYKPGIISGPELIAGAARTFLNYEKFPQFKKFIISGKNFEINFKCMEILVECINKHPYGLTNLELGKNSIKDPNCTDLLLKALSHNKTIQVLAFYGAALDNVDVFSDFLITNKCVTTIKLDYSRLSKLIPQDLLVENEFGARFLKLFGSLQLNWRITAIDWFVEYYYNNFVFGSRNFVGERFLDQRIMERNRKQVKINNLMDPIRKNMKFTDVEIIIE